MHAAVDQMGTFQIDIGSIGGDDLGRDVAKEVENHFVLLDGLFAIGGDSGALLGEAFFGSFGHTHHIGVV